MPSWPRCLCSTVRSFFPRAFARDGVHVTQMFTTTMVGDRSDREPDDSSYRHLIRPGPTSSVPRTAVTVIPVDCAAIDDQLRHAASVLRTATSVVPADDVTTIARWWQICHSTKTKTVAAILKSIKGCSFRTVGAISTKFDRKVDPPDIRSIGQFVEYDVVSKSKMVARPA